MERAESSSSRPRATPSNHQGGMNRAPSASAASSSRPPPTNGVAMERAPSSSTQARRNSSIEVELQRAREMGPKSSGNSSASNGLYSGPSHGTFGATSMGPRMSSAPRSLSSGSRAVGSPETVSLTSLSGTGHPPIHMAPYGNNRALDLFVVAHNGIRRELLDVYNMLCYFEAARGAMHTNEIVRFFLHFEIFHGFVMAYFESVEKKVLWPAVESRHIIIPRNSELQPKPREDLVFDILEALHACIRMRAKVMQPEFRVEISSAFKSKLNTFTELCMHYFLLEEQVIPPLLNPRLTSKDKKELEKELTTIFSKAPGENGLYVVMLSHWIAGSKSRQAHVQKQAQLGQQAVASWKYDNLNAINASRYPVWEKKYWGRMTDDVDYFKRRLAEVEKARAQQAKSQIRRAQSRQQSNY
ncbi:hypothetical protein FVE85_0620 [Porphyridium purpureum]|uniref:Uncharacterized protein n=1 Tax=Porphyridium purpureum TaxID=35688 RepID=A0A5J4YZ35_PORPP|nr:hypothetical protein FVE85_0620 [Porphyridium purpureum]|eukprot:POR1377..scf208_2